MGSPIPLCRPATQTQTHLMGSDVRRPKVERLIGEVFFLELTGCEARMFFKERIKRGF
jgi:hypothetical protein